MSMERKPFEQRLRSLKQELQPWRSQLIDLATYIRPTRGSFDEQPNSAKAPDYKKLIDGTSARSARILGSGMTSGLTSPSRPWFKLGLADQDLMQFEPVRYWLDTVQQRMMAVYSKSNVYGVLNSVYEELGVFGTAATIIVEDFNDVIRARPFTCGEYVIGVGPDGRVNQFGRESWFTVAQLIQEFGKENLPDNVLSAFDKHQLDAYFKVCHLIEPNDSRIAGKQDFRNMPFRSVYWVDSSEADTFLRVAGFEDFPILAPRWDVTTTADPYGKGPGWDALGDIKQLQKMQHDKLVALDKIVNPPMQKDSTVDEVNTLPGGVTAVSSTQPNAGVRPAYQINPDLNALGNEIRQVQDSIAKYFYSDLFLMMVNSDRRQMTAREVVERHEEKLLMLGPVLERLESELLDPLIDRTFNIMLRKGLIPPPPKELQGHDLKVEYISMLAQAQKMVGTTAIEQTVAFVGNLAAAKAEVLDLIDFDEAAIEYGQMVGIPPKIIRSKESVARLRKQAAQAAQSAQMMQMMGAGVQGAKVLSETEVGGNSALDALMGTTGTAAAGGGA